MAPRLKLALLTTLTFWGLPALAQQAPAPAPAAPTPGAYSLNLLYTGEA